MVMESKPPARDLTKLQVKDIAYGEYVLSQAIVMQKNQRSVNRSQLDDMFEWLVEMIQLVRYDHMCEQRVVPSLMFALGR